MKCKITLSGAQCVGKTTIIDKMKQDVLFKDFEVWNEVARSIKREGYNINEMGDNNSQLLITCLHATNFAKTKENAIFDRCALDSLVYAIYSYNNNKISKNILRITESIFENIRYDIMFYIPPEIDLIPDGDRSINKEFQNSITQIFEDCFISYKLTPVRLQGSIDERFNLVKQTYQDWIEWKTKQR